MSNQVLLYLVIGVVGLLLVIILAYIAINKKMKSSEYKQIRELRQGTKKSSFSSEVIFQKLYINYRKIPIIKRYLLKVRRRLEITNIDDEYLTRKQAAQTITKTLMVVIPLTIIIIYFTRKNILLMGIILVFELFLVDTIIDGMVDKIDNNLLKQQIDFFGEIRHAYHESNMVEEAIYQTAQENETQVSRQAEKIYEILISDDPEMGLEKYYDVAPNSYLKEFAGISYLTKEFGDRKTDTSSSLYLKNLNNISQEMQLEILKRDKLDYVFQSLSVISVVPMLFIETIKNWAVGQFSFTRSFYYGKQGLSIQILLVLVTAICYMLTRKLKDNGSVSTATKNYENPWQEKVYKKTKKIVDLFIPKEGTKDYRKIKQLLKDSASKLKIKWLYVNRLTLCVGVFMASFVLFIQLHKVAVNYVYTQPTTSYDILGTMGEADEAAAMKLTEQDNVFLDKFKGKLKTTTDDIAKEMKRSKYYESATDADIQTDSERVYKKLQTINSEYMKWFEMLLAIVFALLGYMSPIWLLIFQKKMRLMEMEDEVMQFHTIILMLMKIERVNVEMILEWLERYSNIFKEPLSKCINNYEAGAWEALEAMKDDVSYQDMVRLIESMQAAVERIPIVEAFDELDSERAYYQEKRKESNNRLISKKGMIGKTIGFAPMVGLFVGYLIVPLVFIGLTSMSTSFSSMSKMTM